MAASRDPRLVGRETNGSATPKSKKRYASSSPDGINKPYPKLARPGRPDETLDELRQTVSNSDSLHHVFDPNAIIGQMFAMQQHIADLACAQITYNHAHAALITAQRKLDNMQPHFRTFAPIKEQAINERSRAQTAFTDAEARVREIRQALEQGASTFVTSQYHSEMAKTDAVQRERYDQLHIKSQDLEKAIAKMNGECSRLQQQIALYKEASDAKTEGALKEAKLECSTFKTELNQHKRTADSEMKSIIQESKAEHSSLAEQFRKQQEILDIKVGESVEQNKTACSILQKQFIEHKTTMDSKLESLKGEVAAFSAVEQANGGSDDLDRIFVVVEKFVSEQNDGLKQFIEGKISALTETLTNLRTVQQQNAEQITECLDQLQTQQAKIDEAATEITVNEISEEMAAISSTVRNLKEREAQARAAAPTNPLALTQFTPIPPPSQVAEEEDPPRAARMESQIQALQHITQTHQRQLDNVFTDQVVKEMVDQMSVLYPDAKKCQVAVDNIRSLAVEATKTAAALAGRVNVTETSSSDLRSDLNTLIRRADRHDHVAEEGIKAIKKLNEDLLVLQGSCERAWEVTLKNSTGGASQG